VSGCDGAGAEEIRDEPLRPVRGPLVYLRPSALGITLEIQIPCLGPVAVPNGLNVLVQKGVCPLDPQGVGDVQGYGMLRPLRVLPQDLPHQPGESRMHLFRLPAQAQDLGHLRFGFPPGSRPGHPQGRRHAEWRQHHVVGAAFQAHHAIEVHGEPGVTLPKDWTPPRAPPQSEVRMPRRTPG
jgi:hypothetical protein